MQKCKKSRDLPEGDSRASGVAHLQVRSWSIPPPPAKGIVELFAPLRGLNLDFERDRDTGRDINL
jgi:hypothetical protein